MIPYVTDTSSWEEWQRDYRLGLILIIPPTEVSERINPLRAKYDPRTYAICPAHITLSDPLRREMTPQRESEICCILSRIQPFTLHFDKPHASDKHAGVGYPIYPREPIDALRSALHAASVFVGEPYYTRNLPPHMTIAEFISIEESLNLCRQLQDTAPSGSFLCDRLEFIVPDQDFHFRGCGTFLLGRSQTTQMCQRPDGTKLR